MVGTLLPEPEQPLRSDSAARCPSALTAPRGPWPSIHRWAVPCGRSDPKGAPETVGRFSCRSVLGLVAGLRSGPSSLGGGQADASTVAGCCGRGGLGRLPERLSLSATSSPLTRGSEPHAPPRRCQGARTGDVPGGGLRASPFHRAPPSPRAVGPRVKPRKKN